MITTSAKLSYLSQTVPVIVNAVQGDTGRNILFTVTDYAIPEDATATYYIQKPSGAAIYNSATISGNTILCELTAQALAEAGENPGQVRILLSGEVVTSFDFILMVKPFRGIDATQSTTEMNIFDQAVEQAEEEIGSILDTTLSIRNKAAEAKAVGDALAGLVSLSEDAEGFIVISINS